jgi:hypothetical protein
MFKRNEGILDRIVRAALGIVLLLAGLIFLGVLKSSVPGLVIAGFGLLALITGLTGVCPLYIPFGINTLEKEKELIARCRSMMTGFHQGSAGSRHTNPEQPCESCPSPLDAAHHPEG